MGKNYFEALDQAQKYADTCSTCVKVKVGSMIMTKDKVPIFGANHGVCDCVHSGCRRIKLYGENSKEHRLPSDCDSIHSEVDAIATAAKQGARLAGATIYVTRYPCEACARAIAASGIACVVYGRKESMSEYSEQILRSYGVNIIKVESWEREDNNA